jgi:hypothetical protein
MAGKCKRQKSENDNTRHEINQLAEQIVHGLEAYKHQVIHL